MPDTQSCRMIESPLQITVPRRKLETIKMAMGIDQRGIF
jgi:hypothetical protein